MYIVLGLNKQKNIILQDGNRKWEVVLTIQNGYYEQVDIEMFKINKALIYYKVKPEFNNIIENIPKEQGGDILYGDENMIKQYSINEDTSNDFFYLQHNESYPGSEGRFYVEKFEEIDEETLKEYRIIELKEEIENIKSNLKKLEKELKNI